MSENSHSNAAASPRSRRTLNMAVLTQVKQGHILSNEFIMILSTRHTLIRLWCILKFCGSCHRDGWMRRRRWNFADAENTQNIENLL